MFGRGLVQGTQEIFVSLLVNLQIVGDLFATLAVTEIRAVRRMLKLEAFHRRMLPYFSLRYSPKSP
jgi:hypothetical protein